MQNVVSMKDVDVKCISLPHTVSVTSQIRLIQS